MSQPPSPYERSYSFTDNSTANPTSQQPGQKIDQELNAARTAINATISRLGEVQADDGKVRVSALNLPVIAEAVEPLLTTAPVQAVNAAGASQVAAVNTAGTTQVANVNAAAAAGAALIAAETTTSNASIILSAQQTAVIAAQDATASATSAQTNANLAYQRYVETNTALGAAQNAKFAAEGAAASAATASSSASSSAALATTEASTANQNQLQAEAHMMAALDAKAQAEAAASQANSIVSNASSQIVTNIQPYLDDAAASATSAHNSANDALASKTAAQSSATAAATSATNASASATSAANQATAAANSATAAALSAATINPANFAPAVHTHTIANVTGLQTALDGKAASSHTHTIANVTGLQSALDAKIGDAPSNGNQYVRQNGSWAINSGGVSEAPISGQMYARYNGGWVAFDGFTKPADALTQDQVYAVANAEYKLYASPVSGGFNTGSGTLTFTDAVGSDGKYVNTVAASMFALHDYGSYWQLEIPTFANTGNGYYAEDVVNFVNGQGGNLTASFSGSYYNDSTDNFAGSTAFMYKPMAGVTNGSRFVLKAGLMSYLQENAITAGAGVNTVAFYNGSAMQWGSPWQLEGYVTSGSLSFYGNLNAANSWNAKQTFLAATTSAASITLPHGTAPSSPVNGDIWTTTSGLSARINGTTKNYVDFDSTQTINGVKTFSAASQTLGNSTATGTIAIGTGATVSGATKTINIGTGGVSGSTTNIAIGATAGTSTTTVNGRLVTSASTTTAAGFRVTQGSAPTTPADGDIWATTSGVFSRTGSSTAAMSAVRAYILGSVSSGVPSITANFNVSSITDNGVGDFTINFNVAMPSLNYAVIGGVSGNAGADGSVVVTSRATGNCRINTIWNGALADVANFSAAFLS